MDIIDKLEKGQSATSLVLQFGCARQTISDFKRDKEKIRAFARKHLPRDISRPGSGVISTKTMHTDEHKSVDEATFSLWVT